MDALKPAGPLTPLPVRNAAPPAARPEAGAPSPTEVLTLSAPSAAPAPAPAPAPPAEEVRVPAPLPAPPTEVEGFLIAGSVPVRREAAPETREARPLPPAPPPGSGGQEVADWCFQAARSGLPLPERTDRISEVLAPAVQSAAVPDPSWEKASPEQVRLFVQETLEHTDALVRIGQARGFDWSTHDFDGSTSKFHPEITQFMAKPGRDESVKWAIARHNGTDHHSLWADPRSTAEDLRESGSDIINAWRMNRRVYDKPSWSWERITRTIEVDFQYNKLSAPQRDALLEAIPFQVEEERLHGLPG